MESSQMIEIGGAANEVMDALSGEFKLRSVKLDEIEV